MPIHADHNLYPGINAHLNSFLQDEGGDWESFHANHVTHMSDILNMVLPPNYYATSEKSLQLSQFSFITQTARRRPDVTLFQLYPSAATLKADVSTAPTATFPLSELIEDEDDFFGSVVIYDITVGKYPGMPVTRLELLSPANKPGDSFYPQYFSRRLETLRQGICLVEVDYLHESRPVVAQLPSYVDREANAFPYMILVNDPRPQIPKGHVDFYGFGVDTPMPSVRIPLSGDDNVLLDFGKVYNHTFAMNARVFSLLVDYAQDPPNFDRYMPDDQQRIRELLAPIRQQTGE